MRPARWVLLGAALAAAGCGGEAPPPPPPEQAPLTVDGWKGLPPGQKYTIDTFERLKAGDPKLYDTARWDAFHKAVVLPARKKDFPDGSKRP